MSVRRELLLMGIVVVTTVTFLGLNNSGASATDTRAGDLSQADETLRTAILMDYYSGWIMIDVENTWSQPNPSVGLLQNDFHYFIRRYRTTFTVSLYAVSNPPYLVFIKPRVTQYFMTAQMRVKPDPDLPDMCQGTILTYAGEARANSYHGSASDVDNLNITLDITRAEVPPIEIP